MHEIMEPSFDCMRERILRLDLSRDARRNSILTQVREAFDVSEKEEYAHICSSIQLPACHNKNVAAVYEAIGGQDLDESIQSHARAVYGILAEAEASVHGCSIEHTHFHEVGTASALNNALCICAAFSVLKPHRVEATPVQTGSGYVECSHGTLSIPAPATAAILARGVPRAHELLEGELCTPTSAALILYFVDTFIE